MSDTNVVMQSQPIRIVTMRAELGTFRSVQATVETRVVQVPVYRTDKPVTLVHQPPKPPR